MLYLSANIIADAPAGQAIPIQYIANMNTPLAMLIAGSNLAQSNIVSSLKSLRMYYLCALKLIIFPVIGMIILYIFNFQSFDFNVPFTVFIDRLYRQAS